MSILNDLKAVLNPTKPYITGKVISVTNGRALVSTMSGRLDCAINITDILTEGDSVHIENGMIIGRLKAENELPVYYV